MLKCRCRIVVTAGTLLLLLAAGARAQTSSAPPTQQDQSSPAGPAPQTEQKLPQTQSSQSQQQQAKSGTTVEGDQKKASTQNKNGTSNDRLLFTLPNFLTLENARQVPPLTSGQKFKVVTRSSFDYAEYPWYAFLAGMSQAENSEPGYGQGAIGYVRRYGAAFADGTIENYFTSAILPSVLHQDPRFFQSGKGGFWHRTDYAVSRIFVTRSDSGNNQFNYSEVFGSAISSAISTYSYHPRQDKTLANTASVWGTQVGWDSATLVLKEFWPDIRRKMHKEKQ
jgi:hypothetical protein